MDMARPRISNQVPSALYNSLLSRDIRISSNGIVSKNFIEWRTDDLASDDRARSYRVGSRGVAQHGYYWEILGRMTACSVDMVSLVPVPAPFAAVMMAGKWLSPDFPSPETT